MTKIEIVQITSVNLNEWKAPLLALEEECFGEGAIRLWELSPFAEIGWILVATEKEKSNHPQCCYGAIEAIPSRDGSVYIYGICVSALFRRKGIGNLLLGGLESLLPEHSRLFLYVSPENHQAIQLYKSIGYLSGATFSDFFGPGKGRLRMEKRI